MRPGEHATGRLGPNFPVPSTDHPAGLELRQEDHAVIATQPRRKLLVDLIDKVLYALYLAAQGKSTPSPLPLQRFLRLVRPYPGPRSNPRVIAFVLRRKILYSGKGN